MRWLHLTGVAILVGGLLQEALALRATAGALASDAAETISEVTSARFRPRVFFAVAVILISGIYNILSSPGHSTRYLILLAVKLLLVLHVFAVAILAVRPKAARRARMMAGGGISGLMIILISAYLRRIF